MRCMWTKTHGFELGSCSCSWPVDFFFWLCCFVFAPFGIKIKFHAAYPSIPYHPLAPSPSLSFSLLLLTELRASVWVCQSLIALTSGITPSHSAVPTGWPQKEKKNTHTLRRPQKKKIDFTRTPQKEKNFISHPTPRAKQSRVPLVSAPSLLQFLSRLHSSLALQLSFVQEHIFDWQEILECCRKWTQVRKMWGF